MYHTEFGRRLRSQSSNSSLSRNQSHESLLLPSSSDRREQSGGSRIGSGLGKRSSVDYSSFADPSTTTTLDDEDPFGEDILLQGSSNGSRLRTPRLVERERPRTPRRGRTGIQGDRLV